MGLRRRRQLRNQRAKKPKHLLLRRRLLRLLLQKTRKLSLSRKKPRLPKLLRTRHRRQQRSLLRNKSTKQLLWNKAMTNIIQFHINRGVILMLFRDFKKSSFSTRSVGFQLFRQKHPSKWPTKSLQKGLTFCD